MFRLSLVFRIVFVIIASFHNRTTKLSQFTDKFHPINLSVDRRGRDRMVGGFTTTYAISAYHH
jgi:hypothetical protein